MAITVRKYEAQVKDPATGNMIPAGLLSSDSLTAINTATTTAVNTIQTKGTQVIASIPSDYTALDSEVDELKSALYDYNEYNILDRCNKTNATFQGITYSWNDDGSCVVSGTATATTFNNIFSSTTSLPDGIKAGDILNITYSTTKNVYLYIYDYSGGSLSSIIGTKTNAQIKIPDTCTGLLIRLWVGNGTVVGTPGETVKPIIRNYNRMYEKKETNYGAIGSSAPHKLFSDANTISEDCRLFNSIAGGVTTVANTPAWAGELETIHTNANIATQKYYPYEPEKHPVMIRGKIGGTWGRWISVGIRGYIEAVDTASDDETGKTDMSSAIQYALDTYGYCKLGPGVFYIAGGSGTRIWMPEGSTLEGSGAATEIRVMSGTNRYAINIHKNSFVKNLAIIGNYTDLTQSDFTATEGNRYAIFYRKGGTDYSQEAGFCAISDVIIKNFNAAGIYQYTTGQNVSQGLCCSNVEIKNCWAGIQIHSLSEFCRYTNVKITYCYIACINNSGNNSFDNCVFHAYSIGMKIDGTLQNSGHGCCSNSSFCHTGNNTGKAIDIASASYGFVFAANQFWYNSIDIANSEGVLFNGCEFGLGTTGNGMTINISGGNTILFNGCIFQNDTTYPPEITVANNNKVKFVNCYGSTSGNAISA